MSYMSPTEQAQKLQLIKNQEQEFYDPIKHYRADSDPMSAFSYAMLDDFLYLNMKR